MSIGIGVLLAIVGCLPVLAGLSSMKRARRLRTQGVAVWAMIVPLPEPAEKRERRGSLLQYSLADGRVIERPAPGATLRPGSTVLIFYDPADPDDVLVFGQGRRTDFAFLSGGLILVLAGGLLAALG